MLEPLLSILPVTVTEVLTLTKVRDNIDEASLRGKPCGILNAPLVSVKADIHILIPSLQLTDSSVTHGIALTLKTQGRNATLTGETESILDGGADDNPVTILRNLGPQAYNTPVHLGAPLVALLVEGLINLDGQLALLSLNITVGILVCWKYILMSLVLRAVLLGDNLVGDRINLSIGKPFPLHTIRSPIIIVIVFPRPDNNLNGCKAVSLTSCESPELLRLDGDITSTDEHGAYLLKTLVEGTPPVLAQEVKESSPVSCGKVNIAHFALIIEINTERRMTVFP